MLCMKLGRRCGESDILDRVCFRGHHPVPAYVATVDNPEVESDRDA